MKLQSLIQVFNHRKKIIPVFFVVLLSFLILSFIVSSTWTWYMTSSRSFFSLDFKNVHVAEVKWEKDIAEDSLLRKALKKQFLNELQQQETISSITSLDASLISYLRGDDNYHGEYIVLAVDEYFTGFFGLPVLEGRNFNQQDLLHPVPAAIIFKSTAQKENIASLDKATILNLKRRQMGRSEEKERKFKVVGTVNDIDFLKTRFKSLKSIIFVYKPEQNRSTDKIYIRVNEDMSREKVLQILSTAQEASGLTNQMNILELKSIKSMQSEQLEEFLEKTKLLIAFIVLIIIYVGATLFGVFYQYVLTRRDEYAIRRSFGCTRRDIYQKVMFEALLYALPGVLMGAFLFSNLAILTKLKSVVPSAIIPTIIILVVTVFAAFIPALYISRQTPVEAFHDE